MASQFTPRKEAPEKPVNRNASKHIKLTVNSSWKEINSEIDRILGELRELKEASG